MAGLIHNLLAYFASKALRPEKESAAQPIHTFGGRGSPLL